MDIFALHSIIDTLQIRSHELLIVHNLQENSKDMGTAIQVVTGKAGRKMIWVVGETYTWHFRDSERPLTWDVFLLQLRITAQGYPNDSTGRVRPEIFGLLPGVDNGALFPGKIDMHVTRRKNPSAIIMGNAILYETTNSTTPTTYPYLIERYRDVEGRCQDKRERTTGFGHAFVADIHAIVREKKRVTPTKLDLVMTLRNLTETIPCPTVLS